jgi:predicted RNA-binding Zn ribbon-like protein
MQRTQLAGNTNVEKLPVLAPFGELAPRLGLDDRMVKVETCELGCTWWLGTFTVETRVAAEGAPGYGGSCRG